MPQPQVPGKQLLGREPGSCHHYSAGHEQPSTSNLDGRESAGAAQPRLEELRSGSGPNASKY